MKKISAKLIIKEVFFGILAIAVVVGFQAVAELLCLLVGV